MVTGRKPTHPVFQDLRWGRTVREASVGPSGIDYTALELRSAYQYDGALTGRRTYSRTTLEQMSYQIRAAGLAMQALMEDLPPGTIVCGDTVDLTQVAPEDLRDYEKRMVSWLERHDKRRNADAEVPIRAEPESGEL